MDNRQEMKCVSCGKSRFLSIREAEEDGWRMYGMEGLHCYNCLPKYSIPTTFLKQPNFVGLGEMDDKKIGLRIEY